MVEPATAKKQIITELSSRQVMLNSSQTAAMFFATVYNDSDRFASFQVKLLAAGVTTNSTKPWYRLTPSVSSKIPVGDCTRFQVEIFDLPPITQQFRGAVDLTVEVTSRELENQYDRQPLRLVAEGLQGQPPEVSLTVPTLEAKPGERIALVAQVHNPTSAPIEATLRLSGLPDRWFPDGIQQTLTLPAGKLQKLTFVCELPPPAEAPSQIYPLQLEAIGRFPGVTATGQLHILPAGDLVFACDPLEGAIPEVLGRWQNPTQGTTTFNLLFHNRSNLAPGYQLAVQELSKNRRWFWQKPAPSPEVAVPTTLPPGVSLGEMPATLSIGSSTIPLYLHRRLPWLGWTRRQRFQVTAQTLDTPLPLQDPTQTLEVRLFPVIPLWLQVVGTLLALGLGTLAWTLLRDPGHRAAVNSVQFNGQGTEVLSGSNDQTVRRWQVEGLKLHPKSRTNDLGKAVRVARYRPVNNDQMALGFENGEIQLANLLTGQRSRLSPDKDDRVFSLVFSRDARTLYSGHGSGLVLQWDTSSFSPEQTTPKRAYNLNFAINSMAVMGENDQFLAIGGRYNRLLLLGVSQPEGKPARSQFLELPYPSGGANDYITSLSTADQQPNLIAVADSQGKISIWDGPACLKSQGRCAPIDKSWLGHEGSPVRAVALSPSGCFLASAGDDGYVKLWALDREGMRRSGELEGRTLARWNQPVKAVDVIETRNGVWVTSGGNDQRVRLYQVPLAEEPRPDDRCPTLRGGGS